MPPALRRASDVVGICDFEQELATKVREGRKKEFQHFERFREVFALVNESFREAAAKLRMGILGVVRVVAVLLAGAEDALRP
jgi:hypothetical protein